MKEQPTFAPALRLLAASSASLDQMDKAKWALSRLIEIGATVNISKLKQGSPFQEPKYFAKYARSLLKAGLAE